MFLVDTSTTATLQLLVLLAPQGSAGSMRRQKPVWLWDKAPTAVQRSFCKLNHRYTRMNALLGGYLHPADGAEIMFKLTTKVRRGKTSSPRAQPQQAASFLLLECFWCMSKKRGPEVTAGIKTGSPTGRERRLTPDLWGSFHELNNSWADNASTYIFFFPL